MSSAATTPSADVASPAGDATQDGSADAGPVGGRDARALPARLGRYHVLAQLGAGGMGVVLAAYDPDLDRKVAVKLLHAGGATGSSGRLLREAHALARLSHPNVVQIHDTGTFGDQIFIAMELVRGVDLRAWLAQPRPLADILRVFLDAGRGLAAAHDAGFVHRDFKPENVLLGEDGRVRVADFGLVRQHDDADVGPAAPPSTRSALDHSLTMTGALLGTPAYMSPEQHMGLEADARSDQFSFCVALWEAVHGHRPFHGGSAAEVTAAVLSGRLTAPPRPSRAPRHITQVLERGLATASEQRFPDMHALLAALARDPARARRRWLAAIVGVGLLVGGAAALRSDLAAPCGGGPDELAATWNLARRQAVVDALAAAPDPELSARTVARLDAYAGEWIDGHRDACLDHRRGEQSSTLLDARMRCLDRRRQTLATAVQLLVDGGGPGTPVPDAAQLVARMPAIGACEDAAVVLSEAAVPEDPAIAAEVAEIEARLISARVRQDAGDVAGALTVADDAVARARRAGFRPILAEALLVQARVHFIRNAYDLARPALSEALTEAVEARRDDLAAEAIARLLYVDGVQIGRTAEALRLAPLALAMAVRAPEPHAALGLAHNNIGVAQQLAGDFEAAAASQNRAVAEMLAAPRHDPLELAGAMFNAAYKISAPDERTAAIARADAFLVAQLGPRHLRTLDERTLSALFAADVRTAAAQLVGHCPEYLRLYAGEPNTCGVCFNRLASLEIFLGEHARALASARRVLECRDGPKMMDGHRRDKARAFIAVHEGRPLEVLVTVARARERLAPNRESAWVTNSLAELEVFHGRALLQLGRPEQAIVALEQALPPFAAMAAASPELTSRLRFAEAQALLAQALLAISPPDRARAAQLDAAAQAALMELGAVPP